MNELALFAGAGGGILGGHLLGWRTVCAVEWESYPASVLCARQNDGLLPPFPIWDDVQTFDGKPWRGIVDVISGGFPCQDISAAGKGVGIDGERSGMWSHMARVVSEVRPKYVFVENSPMLVNRGLERVLGDLTKIGYDTKWLVMGAADVGANHQRDRIWIVGKIANSSSNRPHEQTNQRIMENQRRSQLQFGESRNSSQMANSKKLFSNGGNDNPRVGLERETQSEFGNNCGKKALANSSNEGLQGFGKSGIIAESERQEGQPRIGSIGRSARWWQSEPNVGRVVNGMASRVDRLKAIGNGQVPLCAATAWRILND